MSKEYEALLGVYQPPPDWRPIAQALFERCHFVLCNCRNLGMSIRDLDSEDGTRFKMESVDEYLAQGLEMWPGVRVKRDVIERKNMTARERAAAQRKATRAEKSAAYGKTLRRKGLIK